MRALFADVFRKWIVLITDPLNAAVFMIAFLNAIAPMLPKTVWQGLAVATSAGLCAVKLTCIRSAGVVPPHSGQMKLRAGGSSIIVRSRDAGSDA